MLSFRPILSDALIKACMKIFDGVLRNFHHLGPQFLGFSYYFYPCRRLTNETYKYCTLICILAAPASADVVSARILTEM